MKLKTFSTFVLAIGLAATGCSKKKEEPAADKPATEAAKPTEAKPADTKPAETKPADEAAKPAEPAAAAGAVTFKSDDEYLAAGKASMDKFVEAFKSAGDDCDKLAANIKALAADPVVLASNEYEKAHPEAKKKFEEAAKAESEKVMAAAMPALEKCKDNKAVADAFKSLGD